MATKYYKIKKVKYPIFVLTLFIGLGLIGISILQPESIFGDPGEQIIGEFLFGSIQEFTGGLSALEFVQLDVDPTGQVIGNIILGKPDRSGFLQTVDGSFTTYESTSQGTSYPLSFGTQQNPTKKWYCFAEWDLSSVPNTFTASSIRIRIDPQNYFPNLAENFCTFPSGSNLCNLSQIATCRIALETSQIEGNGQLIINDQNRVGGSLVFIDGFWCKIAIGQTVSSTNSAFVNEVTNSIRGGDEKLTLIVTMNEVTGEPNSGCCWEQDVLKWATAGSVTITGTSTPIICPSGTKLSTNFECEPLNCEAGNVVGGTGGNECVPLVCGIGSEVDLASNTCKVIQCDVGQTLVGGSCQDIICETGTILQGTSCEQIICETGFELLGSSCEQKVCSTGFELVGDSCLSITCPIGTILEGNNCNPITCPQGTFLSANECQQITCESGQMLNGNVCQSIQCEIGEILVDNTCQQQLTCPSGQELIGSECLGISCLATEQLQGNTCVKIPLNCPEGSEEFNNVCVQQVAALESTPTLQFFSSTTGLIDPFVFLIAGVIIAGMSAAGIVIRRI